MGPTLLFLSLKNDVFFRFFKIFIFFMDRVGPTDVYVALTFDVIH